MTYDDIKNDFLHFILPPGSKELSIVLMDRQNGMDIMPHRVPIACKTAPDPSVPWGCMSAVAVYRVTLPLLHLS